MLWNHLRLCFFRQLGPKLPDSSEQISCVILSSKIFQVISYQPFFDFSSALFLYHLCAFAILRIGSLWSELRTVSSHILCRVCRIGFHLKSEQLVFKYGESHSGFLWFLQSCADDTFWEIDQRVHKYFQYFVCDKKKCKAYSAAIKNWPFTHKSPKRYDVLIPYLVHQPRISTRRTGQNAVSELWVFVSPRSNSSETRQSDQHQSSSSQFRLDLSISLHQQPQSHPRSRYSWHHQPSKH